MHLSQQSLHVHLCRERCISGCFDSCFPLAVMASIVSSSCRPGGRGGCNGGDELNATECSTRHVAVFSCPIQASDLGSFCQRTDAMSKAADAVTTAAASVHHLEDSKPQDPPLSPLSLLACLSSPPQQTECTRRCCCALM